MFFDVYLKLTFSFLVLSSAGSGASPIEYIAFTILNKAGKNAQVFTSDNQPAQGISLPSGYSISIMKEVPKGQAITLTAKDAATKSQLLLNNQKSLSVTSSVTKSASLAVVVSAGSISGGVSIVLFCMLHINTQLLAVLLYQPVAFWKHSFILRLRH